MNQILYNCDWNKNIETNNFKNLDNKKSNDVYKIVFFSSIILLAFFIILLLFRLYESNKNEEISKKLTSSYSISTLYSFQNEINSSTYVEEASPFVIGIIKIDKINLNYPILSISNNDLLEVSVCRFAGPMPNEVGNLCIAGHNYVDYKFFSRLNELEINDEINIYDLNGNNIIYKIYDMYETKPNNISCTFQNTDGKRIVTLVTCNNVNGKRLVIHAKEIPQV